jgi:hypothetical protein
MHRCLHILEILSIILSYVHEDSTEGLPTIAALAATCKTLRDPALGLLWHSIPSLVLLVECLPADALKEEYINGDYALVRVVSSWLNKIVLLTWVFRHPLVDSTMRISTGVECMQDVSGLSASIPTIHFPKGGGVVGLGGRCTTPSNVTRSFP